ncbi:3-phenylpropionate/trans-cinnamate dioxygenase ferredoxin reductase subunit [Blastococcus aggregatus]|uniref:3-phenylpropionate/trans-cinnamate dioxygenase ferredoxin reductase subunit n=1 Tax=Blastococcus aggregatus TaxID=38502 RepID=A0A285V9P6_9ACTN|nr:FAD-dependent oxidoreductase [Blastococcus aggregatus]SOC50842.1 3-phenylpropionate/trans-cinnamate dioxygenase ferredoxin reductase subunit [Blastococcus aggregatus]
METAAPFVIVGGGLAGAKAAETLRAEGFDGRIVLVGAEPEVPYERPPLSKGYLLGTATRESARVHEPAWFDEQHVELRTGVRATGLDAGAHRLQLESGEVLDYARLLLAVGSSARRLPVPGADLGGVRYLRTFADADGLRADLEGGGRRVVIVGAGWIGLEVAAAARHHGNEVTVLEPQPTPLHAALGQEMGAVFAELHRAHGVDLFTDTTVRELRGSGGRATAVVTDRHAGLAADLVVIGVGATPNVGLAAGAGLEVDNGVVTDHSLRTSAPDVFAAGDVASSWSALLGRHLRVEHWANALHGGPAAARSMLGQDVVHDRVPYFFTDQYELGMEYSGLAAPGATVVCRGKPGSGPFLAFWTEDGRVTAGMSVDIWDQTDHIQALIRSRTRVQAARLADPGTPLELLVGPGSAP